MDCTNDHTSKGKNAWMKMKMKKEGEKEKDEKRNGHILIYPFAFRGTLTYVSKKIWQGKRKTKPGELIVVAPHNEYEYEYSYHI